MSTFINLHKFKNNELQRQYMIRKYGRMLEITEYPYKTKMVCSEGFPYFLVKWNEGETYFKLLLEPIIKVIKVRLNINSCLTINEFNRYEIDGEAMEEELYRLLKEHDNERETYVFHPPH